MTIDKTNKWYHLYSRNRAVYPSDNQYADGYISDTYEDDMGDSLDEIAEAAGEWTDDYKPDTSQIHIWRDTANQGYNFKMPDSYWEEKLRKEVEVEVEVEIDDDDDDDEY